MKRKTGLSVVCDSNAYVSFSYLIKQHFLAPLGVVLLYSQLCNAIEMSSCMLLEVILGSMANEGFF